MLETNAHSPLLVAIGRHCCEDPGKVALIEGDRRVDYHELEAQILSHARMLQRSGVRRGDRILLAASKEVEMVYLYFAAHLLGVVNVVVDSTTPPERLEYIKSKTSPVYSFGIGRDVADDVAALPVKSEEAPFPSLCADDVADIMFTTGTTGAPKGVCLSHANIAASATNINGFIGNDCQDVEVLGLPLGHSFGLGRLRCVLLAGGTLVLLGNFANLKRFFSAIEQHSATGFGMVPAVWRYIKKFSGTRIAKYAAQLRYIEIGSAALDEAEKRELMHLFPTTRICMHYGLTEASRSFFMEFHESKDNLATIGKPVSDRVKASIGDNDEICVKGAMVMRSYLDPADNDGAFVDGYFRTGDCGYCDADGRYYLTGRIKEMINVGGKKVSPATIEEALHKAGAADCAVVAMPDPDGVLGEVPAAFVTRGGAEIEEIAERAKEWLEPYQVPVRWNYVDAVPRTSSGKIQRLKLKEKL